MAPARWFSGELVIETSIFLILPPIRKYTVVKSSVSLPCFARNVVHLAPCLRSPSMTRVATVRGHIGKSAHELNAGLIDDLESFAHAAAIRHDPCAIRDM